jgi:beta-glucosidase
MMLTKSSDSGEGFANVDGNYGDRNNLTLWQGADAVIANVSATCNNTVLVIHSVGAVEIDQYKQNPNITAILWAGLPGNLHLLFITSFELTQPR